MVQIRVSPTDFLKHFRKVFGSGGIRTHASEETGALNQRLRPLGHATLLQQGKQESKVAPTAEQVLLGGVNLPSPNVYGHIMLKAPVLVRSLKLSNIESC